MRLTIVNQFYLPDLSPTAHLAASLAEHRASLGDRVTVVAGSGAYTAGPATAEGEGHSSVRVVRVRTPSFGKATALRRLLDYGVFFAGAAWTMLTLPTQDAILLMTTPPYISLTGLLHRILHSHTRLILWSMDCYPEALEFSGLIRRGGRASRLFRGLNRWMFPRLETVVCLDEAMRHLLESSYGAQDRPRFLVVPNWEPLELFPPNTAPPAWKGAERLGLMGRQVVLYLGNAGAGHRFETVLQAAKRLPPTEHVFVFIGGGAAWEELRANLLSDGSGNLLIEGYVPKSETPAILGLAATALITLRDEMLGVMSPSKLHSALAAGLPILYIGPPGGNVHEAIERFGCGISLRHGDVDGVVDFLSRLRSDPGARQDYALRSRQAFEAAYTDQIGLARFDSLLDG
jgi:glycosyltransferase involved in cell wall biosynthesis